MILVFVETAAEGATEVSLETVTFARSLAERTGGPVHAVVAGALPEKLADELGAHPLRAAVCARRDPLHGRSDLGDSERLGHQLTPLGRTRPQARRSDPRS